MVTGETFALQAMSERYTGIPYSKLDCQAFVEQVLKDCGVRKPDGRIYNWKGSNSMWRNALSWKGTIAECREAFGTIPLGAWVFILRNDGGEKDKGYNDSEGNASHVGIYVRESGDQIRDSTKSNTRDGVGYRSLKGFTHIGLPKMLSFTQSTRTAALEAIHILRTRTATDAETLEALETLTNYLLGV